MSEETLRQQIAHLEYQLETITAHARKWEDRAKKNLRDADRYRAVIDQITAALAVANRSES